jgi:hypothetical protein
MLDAAMLSTYATGLCKGNKGRHVTPKVFVRGGSIKIDLKACLEFRPQFLG